ncbi:MAG: peptidoglycan endopeptidase [Verrucomicrobiales bacterium]
MLKLACLCFFVCLLVSGCSTGPRTSAQWVAAPPSPQTTQIQRNGQAQPPAQAPPAVRAAVAAANRIANKPYRRGGGHRRVEDSGYDCSGAVSYALGHARLLHSPMPSHAFTKYGRPGRGRWVTIYSKPGHVFLDIAGRRFDTGWNGSHSGPRWTARSRPLAGYVARHPPGL